MTTSPLRTGSRSVRLTPSLALWLALWLTLCLALSLLPAACATPQERIAAREGRLVAAGFARRPADTPQRAAMLARLPDNGFAERAVSGRLVVLYADPLVCGCLYVGSGPAFDRYREQLSQQRLVDEQRLTMRPDPDPIGRLDGWGGPLDPDTGPGLRERRQ